MWKRCSLNDKLHLLQFPLLCAVDFARALTLVTDIVLGYHSSPDLCWCLPGGREGENVRMLVQNKCTSRYARFTLLVHLHHADLVAASSFPPLSWKTAVAQLAEAQVSGAASPHHPLMLSSSVSGYSFMISTTSHSSQWEDN